MFNRDLIHSVYLKKLGINFTSSRPSFNVLKELSVHVCTARGHKRMLKIARLLSFVESEFMSLDAGTSCRLPTRLCNTRWNHIREKKKFMTNKTRRCELQQPLLQRHHRVAVDPHPEPASSAAAAAGTTHPPWL